jgi:riboflavin kinase/FMN adenylyltransferase
MKTLAHPAELQAGGRPVALAIGVFDGVHLGHQEVIRRTVDWARQAGGLTVVATFDRHPTMVVAPDRAPPAIQTTALRLEVFAALGAEGTWLIRFDTAFSRQTGEEFVRRLAAEFGSVRRICVGHDFQFGHRRSGDVALLDRLGRELGFRTEAVPPFALDGQTVSSTRIRELIRDGALVEAGRLLGRPYALAGRVVRGDQLGRRLGYPTANLDVAGLQLPPNGVYAVRGAVAGQEVPGVMNIGFRPTVAGAASVVRVEVHLLDWEGDLYGRGLTVRPVRRLRPEERFESAAALQAQIAQDVTSARAVLAA